MIPDEAHRANFDKLLRLLNIFISLVQDCDISKKTNSAKLKELGIEIMMFHKTSFPFARITPTVHMMLAHTHELFSLNEGRPISLYSEQGSEGWHKHLRAFQSGYSAKARQTSLKDNLKDVFLRMMYTTEPTIVNEMPHNVCKMCTKSGHNQKSCKTRVSKALTEEEAMKASFYV